MPFHSSWKLHIWTKYKRLSQRIATNCRKTRERLVANLPGQSFMAPSSHPAVANYPRMEEETTGEDEPSELLEDKLQEELS